VGNVDVDALEIVGAGTADGDLIGFLLVLQVGHLVAHGQTSIFRHYGLERELIEGGLNVQRLDWAKTWEISLS
jgi:hypothetical protein